MASSRSGQHACALKVMYRKHCVFTVLSRIWSSRKLNDKWSLGRAGKGQGKDWAWEILAFCSLPQTSGRSEAQICLQMLQLLLTCCTVSALCSVPCLESDYSNQPFFCPRPSEWADWPGCHQALTCSSCDCPIPAQQHPLFGHCTSSSPGHHYSNSNTQFHSLSCSRYPYMLLQCLCSI